MNQQILYLPSTPLERPFRKVLEQLRFIRNYVSELSPVIGKADNLISHWPTALFSEDLQRSASGKCRKALV